MLNHLRPALILFILLTLITGVLYPLTITAVAQLAFPTKANGSIITENADQKAATPIGSALIGQEFGTSDPAAAPALAKWFWGRPSATSPVPYTALNLTTATASSGSNLAPTNPALLDNIKARIAALNAADSSLGIPRTSPIPIDLVTSSASGLDPHISLAAAEYQLPRIAKARNISEDTLRALILQHTETRTLGILGEPVVNVLTLNRALASTNHP